MSDSLLHLSGLDVARGHEADFDRRFRDVYLPQLLARPGWLAARLYECIDGEPTRLTLYDLDREATSSPANETPLLDPILGRRIRNYHARTYRQISAAGEDPASSDLINLITVDIGPRRAPAFSRWYDEIHVPEIVRCPGWNGARRYESINGEPRFLAIYGLEDATTPFATDEYEAAVGWDDFVGHIRGYHGFRIYRLVDEFDAQQR